MGNGTSGSGAQSSTTASKIEKKPMKGLISDVTISLPAEEVSSSCGCAIDIGSSSAKIIYRSNKEYKNGVRLQETEDSSNGIVHFALFPRTDLDGIVTYLKENVDFKCNDEGLVEINTSGVGGAASKTDVEKVLNAKIAVLSEFDCFVKGFVMLTKTRTKDDLVHSPSEKTKAAAEAIKAEMDEYLKAAAEAGQEVQLGTQEEDSSKTDEEPKEGDNPHLPCLLAMCGSGTGTLLIQKDETYRLLEGPMTCGKFFHGLASYLGGTNDFEELLEMASKADGRSTDIYASDLIQSAGEEEEKNVYNLANMNMLLFPCGKLVEAKKGDIKKEDLVYSLYNTVAAEHLQFMQMLNVITKVKKIYFCGNLFNNELGRDLILLRKGLTDSYTPPDQICEFEFVKNGGMVGVLGAFLTKPKSE